MECQGDGIAVVNDTTKVCHEKSDETDEKDECKQNDIYTDNDCGQICEGVSSTDIIDPGINREEVKSKALYEANDLSADKVDKRLQAKEYKGLSRVSSSCIKNQEPEAGKSDVVQEIRSVPSGNLSARGSDAKIRSINSETIQHYPSAPKSDSHSYLEPSSQTNFRNPNENGSEDENEGCEQGGTYVVYNSGQVSEEGTPRDQNISGVITVEINSGDPSEENDQKADTTKKTPQVRGYCEGPPSGGTYNAMYGPDAGTNNDNMQGIPGLPSDQLLEYRHDIISSTSINPYSNNGYGHGPMPENDSPCYFMSSSRQIFTVVESVVHFLTQPVVNFIRGEWIVSFMPFPIAQHVCISLDDGMKRYEEVLKVEPNYENPSRVLLVSVEHRLVPGNTMHRPRFKEALRQSLAEVGKQLSGEAPWEIFVSRASGRSLSMDTLIHSFLSESHEPLETHCSPLVDNVSTPIFAKLAAAPYSIVGNIFRPVLRHGSWLVASTQYQLHETLKLDLNYKTRRIEATCLDSSLARTNYGNESDIGSSLTLLDAVSYNSDSITGNLVLSNNTILDREIHPFLNFENNPIFNRGSNACFNATFAPPSNSNLPVNSVGLIITPPGHGGQMAPNQMHPSQGNFPIVNQYPAPLFAYSPYGLLQQVVPPIPIVPDNFYGHPPPFAPAYGHFIEIPRQDLTLNPNAQDFYPDMPNDRPATAEPYSEHDMNSSLKHTSSETTLQISHCQVTGTFVHRSPSNYESEPGVVVVRARDSQSDLTNEAGCASRTHSKSWSEETEAGEHEIIDGYQYSNPPPVVYEDQQMMMDNCYGSDKSYSSTQCPDCNPSRRKDHYQRGNVNYYGNYKPRYHNSGNPNSGRYNQTNEYPHGSESPRQNQHGNYSPPERGGNYYNRGRGGGRGRNYKQKPHYNNQNSPNDGSYYRRGNRYNNNNNYKKPPE